VLLNCTHQHIPIRKYTIKAVYNFPSVSQQISKYFKVRLFLNDAVKNRSHCAVVSLSKQKCL